MDKKKRKRFQYWRAESLPTLQERLKESDLKGNRENMLVCFLVCKNWHIPTKTLFIDHIKI